jgi:riboflavin kinase/FMN adenylyltransferase
MDVDNGQGAARSVVTIGAYDGVHAGHRRLIGEVLRVAAERGLRSVAVTFDRHPATVVRPQSAPKVITDLEQKLDLLGGAGLDEVVVIPFDAERASESAEDFVNEILVGRLDAAVVIVGRDFHFGHGRRGNVQLLEAMGEELGFDVVGFALLTSGAEDDAVSSTRIRALIEAGDVEGASKLLGRAHEVRGEVESASPAGAGGVSTIAARVPGNISVPGPGSYGATVSVGPVASSDVHRAVVTIAPRTGAADPSAGPQVTFEIACGATAGGAPEIGAGVRISFDGGLGAADAAQESPASLDSLVSGGRTGGVA